MRIAAKSDDRGGALGLWARDFKAKNNKRVFSSVKQWRIILWGPFLLQLLLAAVHPCSLVAADISLPAQVHIDLSSAYSLQQEGPSQAAIEGGEAPRRRLSSAAEWAADVEGSLRLSPRFSLYLGVFLTLSGSLLMAGGSTLMKLGLSVEDEDTLRGQSCDQQWLWGFAGTRPFVYMYCLPLSP